jgi:hypothetical protein
MKLLRNQPVSGKNSKQGKPGRYDTFSMLLIQLVDHCSNDLIPSFRSNWSTPIENAMVIMLLKALAVEHYHNASHNVFVSSFNYESMAGVYLK